MRVKAWLELVRVPNLPTVPGDPLAGFALASLGAGRVDWVRALPAVGASLLLYMAGMIWNDCADLAEDRRDRPQRPLASGRIRRRDAMVVAGLMAVAGVALAGLSGWGSMAMALLLLLLVLAYDFVSRRIRLLGFINMGACRGVSLLLGASALGVPSLYPISAAVGVSLYIACVTRLACDEVNGQSHGVSIGLLIRLLLVIQACLCVSAGWSGVAVGAAILLGWPVSALLNKRFYAS